jgi:hypothetical protein
MDRNRYAELTESQRRQIDLLINSLASEPDHDPIRAIHWWVEEMLTLAAWRREREQEG